MELLLDSVFLKYTSTCYLFRKKKIVSIGVSDDNLIFSIEYGYGIWVRI